MLISHLSLYHLGNSKGLGETQCHNRTKTKSIFIINHNVIVHFVAIVPRVLVYQHILGEVTSLVVTTV